MKKNTGALLGLLLGAFLPTPIAQAAMIQTNPFLQQQQVQQRPTLEMRNCPECDLTAQISLEAAPFSSGPNQLQIQNTLDVSRLFFQPTPHSGIQWPESLVQSDVQGRDVNWSIGQALPGSFQRPWGFPEMRFNPTFQPLPPYGYPQAQQSSQGAFQSLMPPMMSPFFLPPTKR